MQNPNTLVLEIFRQDNSLSMSIFEEKDIVSTVRNYSQRRYAATEIHKFCQEVISILNKADRKGVLESEIIKNFEKVGQLLWEHLFTPAIKERLRATSILDLVLSLDEDLINIPWELLYDGKNFLCLKFNLGRLVRTKQKRELPQYRGINLSPRMLILADPTTELKSAYQEGIQLKKQFERRRDLSVDFKSRRIDTLYVKKNLRDYDIVHFAGHSEHAPEEGNTGWRLEDGIFSVKDITVLGETFSLPSLVFSNACHSAGGSLALIERNYQERNYSLACAFLFSGVRHYIGTVSKIEDAAAFIFAREFYTQLIKRKSVGESMRLGRLKLIQEYGINSIFWTSYLLYGDPRFALFKPGLKLPAARQKEKKKTLKELAIVTALILVSTLLYKWLPTVNPATYLLFLKSDKLLSRGGNQEVILNCEQLVKKEPLFLETYPLLAQAYQRLGKKEQALKCYFDYIVCSQKKADKRHLATAYTGIGWLYQSYGEYAKAFDFYNKALNLARENKNKLEEAIVLRKLAVWHMDREENDKALEFLTKSSEINRERQHKQEHKYNLACDYFDLGLVFTNKEDFSTAKEFYAKSRRLFEGMKLKNELSDYYFNLGEIFLFEKQYQKALDAYFKGLEIDRLHDNKPSIASDYNILGELYLEMDNLTEAEKYFCLSLSVCGQIEAPLELAGAYHSLGILYKKKGERNKASEYLGLAQNIYLRIEDAPAYQQIQKEISELNP